MLRLLTFLFGPSLKQIKLLVLETIEGYAIRFLLSVATKLEGSPHNFKAVRLSKQLTWELTVIIRLDEFTGGR
jgi:hypothetical protein